MKKYLSIIIIVLVCLIGINIVKNLLVESIISFSLTKITGARTEIGSLSFGILTHAIKIKGLKIHNPKGYGGKMLLDIPIIYINYDLLGLLGGRLHLKQVTVDLKETVIIKDKEGRLNVDSLKVASQKEEVSEPSQRPKSKKMQIDRLTLSIGRVIFEDYTAGDKPFVQVYDVGIKDKTFRNITDARQLVSLVLVEAMKPTAIKSAAIYSVAALTGVAMLPVGVGVLLTGKDSAKADVEASFDRVFTISRKILSDAGEITKEDRSTGHIKGKLHKNDIEIKIAQMTPRTISIAVSARKYLIPQPSVASGILYQILEKIK